MKILITGANGFIGKNLKLKLAERGDIEIITFTSADSIDELPIKLGSVDFVFHLAGVNRSENENDFTRVNSCLTSDIAEQLCSIASETGKLIPLIYTSSSQAELDNVYGLSKREAELSLTKAKAIYSLPIHIFRLPNVFGKWCRPNYNSAVATFCHNVARGVPIRIDNSAARLNLAYIDDVIEQFIEVMDGHNPDHDKDGFALIKNNYFTTVGDVADSINSFRESRETLVIPKVGSGLLRALYSTYVSHLPPETFVYPVPMHTDARGSFVEMLKTEDSGQFSFFTAHPGITRGGHYHHTKTEKFLVIKGTARFKFRHMDSGEVYELTTSSSKSEIVETVPGWTHDITNIGDDEMIVMLWANEIFDRSRPDTIAEAL
jgi:UDP-2-acetamido-2,6-beta-L-arabino-hexul-4-ose reductase